jgi:hypothetical protein
LNAVEQNTAARVHSVLGQALNCSSSGSTDHEPQQPQHKPALLPLVLVFELQLVVPDPTPALWLCGACAAAATRTADVVQITRKFLGFHCMKHYYVTRQFDELTGVVLNFLKELQKEDGLPAAFRAQLDPAVQVRGNGPGAVS